VIAALLAALPLDVPVDPDAPEAQDWIVEELSKPEYQAAQPNWFDRVSREIFEWLMDALQNGGQLQGPPTLVLTIVLVLVVGAIVFAILIFGVPRRGKRSAVAGSIFGDHDERSAARIRQDAERAATAGDFSTAIAELFRAIARGLAEREVLTTFPGTTATDFAARSGSVFPSHADRLRLAAQDFDGVRYLDRVGTAEQYAAMAALERDLRTARASIEPGLMVPA
jgi:uncharacterized protein DUF4129